MSISVLDSVEIGLTRQVGTRPAASDHQKVTSEREGQTDLDLRRRVETRWQNDCVCGKVRDDEEERL